jgi:hypothetical protein
MVAAIALDVLVHLWFAMTTKLALQIHATAPLVACSLILHPRATIMTSAQLTAATTLLVV